MIKKILYKISKNELHRKGKYDSTCINGLRLV
jgi:hypothetical protein